MNNGIYIHIPFCLAKCAYCDFNSRAGALALAKPYIKALTDEMRAFSGLSCDTVYIGGGTPTVLGEEELSALLTAVRNDFDLSDDTEFTVESNPATADVGKYELLRSFGVNRLSIGVQSFIDEELSALSRIHTAEEALRAIDDAKAAGFTNISLDLMEGIPHQTLDSLSYSLSRAISSGVTHISVYSLILEEGTPFYAHPPVLPTEDEERAMYHRTRSVLTQNGFCHYEISNYAKKGYASRHNTKYWTGVPYYGFGAGAHSFYGDTRYENEPDIETYINADDKRIGALAISEREKKAERFLLGFRMLDGVDTRGEYEEKLSRLASEGLIVIENGRARLTERGEDLANQVFMEFVGDDI